MTTIAKPRKPARAVFHFALIAVAGGVAGYGFGWLAANVLPDNFADGLRWSDGAALIIATALVFAGGVMMLMARNGRTLAAAFKSDAPASSREVLDSRIQGAVVIGSGALLATPPIAAAFDAPNPEWIFLALMAATAVHSLINFQIWRRGDELIRRIVVETGAICFWIVQIAIFAWAAAERLGLETGVTPWDVLTLLMAIYLTCSVVVSIRRGLN